MPISTHNPEDQANGKTAVIAVDVQRDFRPGGALAVSDGDAVVAPLLAAAEEADYLVVSGDQHPRETVHFDKWPVHCVSGTAGADIAPELLEQADVVISKGMSNADDGYSAFEGQTPDGQPLADWLRGHGVTRVAVGGLATDYCVRATALDAIEQGFETTLLAFASRGVDLKAGDSARAIEEVAAAGAKVEAAPLRPFLDSRLDLGTAEGVEL
jgi:nicotinamidase/pyrazinamidase